MLELSDVMMYLERNLLLRDADYLRLDSNARVSGNLEERNLKMESKSALQLQP